MNQVPAEFMTSSVAGLLHGIRGTGDRSYMPIIADALQDAGCEDEELLDLFRSRTWGLTVVRIEQTHQMDPEAMWPRRLAINQLRPGETVRIEVPEGQAFELSDDWQAAALGQGNHPGALHLRIDGVRIYSIALMGDQVFRRIPGMEKNPIARQHIEFEGEGQSISLGATINLTPGNNQSNPASTPPDPLR